MAAPSLTRSPAPKVLPLAAGLAGGYLQNKLTSKIAGRLNRNGGTVQRVLVSLLVSWLVGKAVNWGQRRLADARNRSR